jgi:glucose/arabinose dehydrogenase
VLKFGFSALAFSVACGCVPASSVHPGVKVSGSGKSSLAGAVASPAQGSSQLPQGIRISPLESQDSHPNTAQGEKGPGVPDFWVRPGYRVTLVASDLGNARFMVIDEHGTLYLSRPNEGDIVMLRPSGGKYTQTGTFVEGYRQVHGMQVKDGWLWFTSAGKVTKARVSPDGKAPATGVQDVLTGLPTGGHWWRSVLVTDQYLYTSIGDDGNINDDQNDRERVWRYNLDGGDKTLYVSGIRNTEKLLVRPGTQEIYGCDQGSDWFGQKVGDHQGFQPVTDYNPPEEFNHYVMGGFYGHPFIVGNRLPRYEYMNRPDIDELAAKTIPPAYCFGPHWAADGWIFLSGASLPAAFDRDALVAFHGSWNRSEKAGYRVEHLMFDKVIDVPIGSEMLVGTLGKNHETLGRPVDVVQEPSGSILFSDDQRNAIYRIEYLGGRRG